MAPAPTGMPPIDAATPRSTRGNGPSQVRWDGCPLVEVDPAEPKWIPAGSTVGIKVELLGWTDIDDEEDGEDSVPACRLSKREPLEIVMNLEFTRDDLHRRYGAGIYFAHAYVMGENEKGAPTLRTPITGQTHKIEPLDFDEPKDSDPQHPLDDVGTQGWKVPTSALDANAELKEEIARRRETRKDLGIGEERARGGNDRGRGGRGGRQSARGGRGSDRDRGRGGRGGRPWGPGSDDDDHGRGYDDEPEMPEEMLDPTWTPAPAPPGMVWAWDAYKLHWRQYPAGSAPAQAPAVAPVTPPAPPSFFETPAGIAMIGVFGTIGAAVATEMVKAKPDALASLVPLLTAMTGPKENPLDAQRLVIEQKKLELQEAQAKAQVEIEDKRSAAQALREKEADDRRAAVAREARIEAEAAAERNQKWIIGLRAAGLDPNAKPQRTEEEIRNAIKAEMRAEQLQRELDAARGVGDIAAQIKRAEGVLKAAGIDVASEASKSMLMEFFGTDAGKAVAIQGMTIADRLVNLLMAPKGANGQPLPPAPQGPTQAQIDAFAAQQQEIGRQQALAEMQRQQTEWDAAQVQQVPGVPAPVQMPPAEAPPMPAWQAVPAPAEAPPPVAEPAPVEAPAEVPPAVEAAPQAPESSPVDEPTPEAPAAPEMPAETDDERRSRAYTEERARLRAERAAKREAAAPDPASVIDRAPEGEALA